MAGIILEWLLLFLALVVAMSGGYWLWVRFTWTGKRFQRRHHKTVIETGAEIRCPIHGLYPAAMGIDTEFGEVCPQCYQTYVQIPTFTIDKFTTSPIYPPPHDHDKPTP